MKTIRIGQPVFAIPNNIPGWPNADVDLSTEGGWNLFFEWLLKQSGKNDNDMWKPVTKRVVRKYMIGNAAIPWGPNSKDYTFVSFLPDFSEDGWIGFIVYNNDIEEK